MSFRIAFYRGTRPGMAGLYNRLVRALDGGQYSHVELVFSDGLCASSSQMDGGVRFRELVPDPARWDVFELAPARFDEEVARRWFTEHEGDKYDTAGNLKFVWHWWPQSDAKWFCSEAIAAALQLPGKAYWYGPNKLVAAIVAP